MLDTSGGGSIKVISKVENEAGLEHFDSILRYTDGVMVARGDLAMEVRPGRGGAGGFGWLLGYQAPRLGKPRERGARL